MSEFIEALKQSAKEVYKADLDDVMIHIPNELPVLIMHSQGLVTTEQLDELALYKQGLVQKVREEMEKQKALISQKSKIIL